MNSLRNDPDWRQGYKDFDDGLGIDGNWSRNRIQGWLDARDDSKSFLTEDRES